MSAAKKTTAGKTAAGQKKQSSAPSKKGKTTAARKTTRKTSTANHNKKAGTRQRTIEDVNEYKDRLAFETGFTLVVLLMLAVFLYFSFFGLCGVAGTILGGLLFGIFGWISWILPLSALVCYIFYIINQGGHRVLQKIFSFYGILLVLTGMTDLISDTEIITEYYKGNRVLHHGYLECMNLTLNDVMAHGKGTGGLVGRGVSSLFSSVLGSVGAGVILTALLLLCIYLFVGMELMGTLRRRNSYRREMEHAYQEYSEEGYEDPSYRVGSHGKRRARRSERYGQNEESGKEKGKVATFQAADSVPSVDLRKMNERLDQIEKQMAVVSPDVEEKQEEQPLSPDISREAREKIRQKLKKQEASKEQTEEMQQEKKKPERVKEERTEQKVLPKEKEEIPEDVEEVSRSLDIPIYREELKQKFGRERTAESLIQVPETAVDATTPMASFAPKPDVIDITPSRQKQTTTVRKDKRNDAEVREETAGEANTAEASKNESSKKKEPVKSELTPKPEKPVKPKPEKPYEFPPIDLLQIPEEAKSATTDSELRMTAAKLQATLKSFNVNVQMGPVICGPTVTRYELQPEQGVRVNKITNLADDLKLSLAAPSIRIEAPIPGKSAVGIEVPNSSPGSVFFRELLEGEAFRKAKSPVTFAVGKDIAGKRIMTDIAKMPHLLIAGATGSGKSVCINTLIMSILYKANPADVKLIMIDPKVVELSVYNGIPHLFCPVVTDPKEAAAALNWAVREMMERYEKFKELGVRNISGYNEKIKKMPDSGYAKMPLLVIIVDEFADLMMVASKEVEDAVCRLAQLARAAGIHLVLATQRPSVNVITGVIKANIPSRIAFSVSSAIDSRTILDKSGAEKLIGKGDMLFFPAGYSEPVRVQGAFVSDREVGDVVDFLCEKNDEPEYNHAVTEIVEQEPEEKMEPESVKSEFDEYFEEAGYFVIESERAAAGQLQRRFSIGFNRAGRIIDQLHKAGVVGPAEGTKPRKILMTREEFEDSLGKETAVEEAEAESAAVLEEYLETED